MNKQPTVKFYTAEPKNPREIWLSRKEGNIGSSHLVKFTYESTETESSKGDATFAFTDLNFDISMFQPGVGFGIRYGYVGGSFSEIIYVAVKEAEYRYSSKGHIIRLKIIPIADYKEEGAIRNIDGSAQDLFTDTAQDSQLSIHYKSFRDGEVSAIKKADGNYESVVKDAEGKVKVLQLGQKIAPIDFEDFSLFGESWGPLYQQHYAKMKDEGYSNIGYSGSASDIPFFPNNMEPTFKLNIADEIRNKAVVSMFKAMGLNYDLRFDSDKAEISPVDWLQEPQRTFRVGHNIISYVAEKSSEEARVTGASSTSIDPTTGSINNTKVTVVDPYSFSLEFPSINTTVVVWSTGTSYYLRRIDDNEPIPLKKDAFDKLKTQYLSYQRLLKKGLSPETIKEKELQGKTFEDMEKSIDRAIRKSQQLRAETFGFEPGDIDNGVVEIRYSGRNIRDIKNQAIKSEMDKVFYNLKLTIRVEGDPSLVRSENFTFIANNPFLSGVYHTDSVEHSISNSGYITSIVGYKIVEGYDRIVSDVSVSVEEGVKAKVGDIFSEAAKFRYLEEVDKALQKGLRITQEERVGFYQGSPNNGAPRRSFGKYDQLPYYEREDGAYQPSSADTIESFKSVQSADEEVDLRAKVATEQTLKQNMVILQDTTNATE